jgi:signal transduction histidine kinase
MHERFMKILVVDDNRVSREIVKKELEDPDFQILEADNGLKALELIEAEADIDLVTLDVEMPKMNGYEVCSNIRAKELQRTGSEVKRLLPIIFVTGDDTLEGRRQGFEAGATDFIVKGFSKRELRHLVDRLLKPERRMAGLKVLVAEDKHHIRASLRAYLEELGVNVAEAKDGQAALDFIQGSEQIDLLLASDQLAGLDGVALCQKLRRELNWTEIPIVLLTENGDRSYGLSLLKAGATDYLMKPLVKEELFARLNVFLEVVLLNVKSRHQVEELKKLNQLKDDFLRVCSHDLKSPITGILGMAQLLPQLGPLTEPQQEMCTHIRKSGHFLQELIDDLLDLNRYQDLEQLEAEPVELLALLQECLKNALITAQGKKITLQQRWAQAEAYVLGDKTALMRIFNNLLSNAVKFTPKGGRIDISLQSKDADYVLKIQDSGIGIPEKDLETIFDSFQKRSRKGTAGERGTGLGLSITKSLTEKQNGSISISSTVGSGTTVTLHFPQH